jgi:hypothetical protein
MSKPKALKKDDVEKLVKHVERLKERVNSNGEPWQTVGYARASIDQILKMLTGEYPIF